MSLKAFSKRLNELIKAEKLSKKGLADKANIQQKSILNYLNGRFYPRYDSLIKLADFFEVSTDYLLGIENEVNDSNFNKNSIDDVPNIFRAALKDLIKTKDMTEYRLAKELKVEQSTISKWHHQKTMPEIALVIEIARIFDCKVDYLLGRTTR